MHAKYQRQFPILHGIVILTGMWSVIYSILEWDESLNNLKASSRPFDFLNLIPFNALLVVYLILMVIGVRNENNRMLVTFHISNLCQAIFMGWWTFRYCDNYYESVQECINFDIFFQTNLVIVIITLIFMGLASYNTLICQLNFGNNLGFYIKYEPTPDEFQYKNNDPDFFITKNAHNYSYNNNIV
ncbi:5418_t:CDS:2 [Entrophospora sp. SA101]|nr:5418_t:CDS:2 [Entrophospora sp. SA101]